MGPVTYGDDTSTFFVLAEISVQLLLERQPLQSTASSSTNPPNSMKPS